MRLMTLLSLILFLASCQTSDYTLNISVDAEDNNNVFLIALDDNNQPQTLDTLSIQGGVASYTSTIELPEMHYLLLEGNRDVVPVVLEPGEIMVEIYKDSIRASKASGTKSNKDFRRYIKSSTPLIDDLFGIQNEMRNAMISRDSLAFVDLQEQLNEMQAKFKDFQVSFVSENTDSYISTLILEQLILNKGIENEESQTIFNAFSKTIKKTKAGLKIEKTIFPSDDKSVNPDAEKKEDGDVSVGSKAPNFTAPNLDGNPQGLYATLGKYTLVDFWASWCGPCRVESPKLVEAYNLYKDKGLAILSVSLDKNDKSWRKAIENDNLNWNHVSNLKRWEDPIAALYGVTSIPQLFLLDENGQVVARDHYIGDILPILESNLL
ncbi:MAG: Thiol-disulfide oxidoreductase ResA [Bacteroidota bacterium]|nr:MAG: Thiol-disulfide oxidoreductase ResA [Bacteroidota bacterium]